MSDADREQKAHELFLRALEMGQEERATFLDRSCGNDSALKAEVESLLHHHQLAEGTFLAQPAIEVETDSKPGDDDATIGPYRLLRALGEGGMGQVWLAEQREPLRRKVALKIIKPGMGSHDVLARFETERQALARMNHPCVAKVFDAGTTPDGRPYFAMEYVEGVSITEHCDQHRLTTAQRLELFEQVCQGVQHAHQKAIVHRDLKPSNILVSVQDGKRVPKIIDFGVAKAIEQRLTERTMFTQVGAFIGTPEYMSPEQAGLSNEGVDTRTDTYSLGVVLYEMLVGALPFESQELREAGFDGLCRKIREDQPPRPTQRLSSLAGKRARAVAERRHTSIQGLQRELRGELEWITMSALEKDPSRRYASASDMSADVRRYLNHEPVLAAPPSAAYRFGKFVRRHRLAVGAAATVLLGLLVGVIGVGAGMLQAREEADRANREALAAQEVSDFMVRLFKVPDPSEAKGEKVTAREVLDRGAKDIREQLADQPAVRSKLMHSMAEAYQGLGLYDEARDFFEESYRERAERLGASHPDAIASQRMLARASTFAGEPQKAREILEQALQAHGRRKQNRMGLMLREEYAKTLFRLGEHDTARVQYEELLDYVENHPDATPRSVAQLYNNYANVLRVSGDIDGAFEAFSRSYQLLEENTTGNDANLAQAMINASGIRAMQGNLEEATVILLKALPVLDTVFGPDHLETIGARMNLAVFYFQQEKYDEAETAYRDVLERAERKLGSDHPQVAMVLHNLALLYSRIDEHDKAVPLFSRALRIRQESLGEAHPSVASTTFFLAQSHAELHQLEQSVELFEQLMAIDEKTLDPNDPEFASDLEAYAEVLEKLGRTAKATATRDRARTIRKQSEADQ